MGKKTTRNTRKDRHSNLNQIKIETANELGLDYKDGKFTGKISKEAYSRSIESRK
ncbi:hypothetical protein [Alkalithermobacter paradoxus]|uniref:Uncharacterized protein n=1 Tax=Alkalithermobacter paradoxus TaxID=29349 RepID=A0A1V4ICD5_9FIRM|nr:hypothetical protein CLOTH_04600 [[Clostridium] thermoalcaliphilum]